MRRAALILAPLILTALPLAPALAATPPAPAQTAAASAQDQAFAALSARYIATLTRLEPVLATALGNHAFDDQLPDRTPAGRAAMTSAWQALLADLAKIDRQRLSRDNQVDAALLDNQLRYDLWSLAEVQDWAWNLQYWNDTAAGALYGLAARDFAPWPTRIMAATRRMEAIPALLAEARRQIVPARVPPVYADVVGKQNGGIVEIAETMLAPHAGDISTVERDRFRKALASLKAAVAEHQTWLDTVVKPAAKGDFRLGAARYDAKMAFALQSRLTRPDLKARAIKAVADTRAEMYALSRRILAGRAGAPPLPETPDAAQQQAGIEAALAVSYASRPPREKLEDTARETLATATAFVREKGLVGMPDGPVRVITMPKFQQGNSVAYDDAPGPLERTQPNFYAVSPVPAEWTEAQATSYLSEYNTYMVHDLSIHEAMPGHYLQLDHANRDPSTLRAVLSSGPFVEGWAVYAEGVMKDAGYLGGDPLFALTVLKMRLRSITNTLLDIGIHTEGMTRDQAMDLMTRTAFQQEREAAGKWIRASLSSVQLLSYFTGYEEHRLLRAEAMQRQGTSFTLRAYNDAVLSHGSPPVRYVRDLMFGLPVGGK